MVRHSEPSLRGRTKTAKDRRKEFFRSVYRYLEAGETVLRTDKENYNGRWRPVREKWIGTAVESKHRGSFRRRSKGFVELKEVDQ